MTTILQAMRTKLWTSIGSRLPCRSQIASKSAQGAKLSAPPWIGCESCAEEENGTCRCELSGGTAERKPKVGEEKIAGGANSSFAHAVMNMVGMLVGLGQLSTPYALEKGGWSSAFLLIGLGIICAYTSHLLGKCMEKIPKCRSYRDIGQEAYGSKGKFIAETFIYLTIFMALVSFTISLHDNLSIVFSGARIGARWAPMSSSQLLTVIAVLIALPSLWLRDLSSISFLSSVGVLLSFVIFASVVLTAVFGGVGLDHEIPALRIRNIPGISGLYVFSYAGHIVFPDLYKSMRDPSKFTKASIVSFALATALYTGLAFMGARMFGPGVSSQITLSLPRNFIVTKVALWATVLTPMTKYALQLAPFVIHLDRCLARWWSMSSSARMAVRGTASSVLLLVILSLALSVPYFEYVLGLTGSLVSIGIGMILPCGFYTKIYWPSLSRPILVLNAVVIGFGCVLGVFGTISSSRSLVKCLQARHSA